jgi:hypothetical protein
MIAAFDMGIKNFAFAVKSKDDFILLKNTSLDQSSLTKTDLNKIKKKELTELMSNLKISHDDKLTKKDMTNLILIKHKSIGVKQKDLGLALFEIMDSYKSFWDECEIFLIERQMTTNRQALKLSHYLEAYLKIYYPSKTILNYNAFNKTKKLGATNLKTKKDRKEWTIKYTAELLVEDNLKYFESLSKKDDVADVVCMIESYLSK